MSFSDIYFSRFNSCPLFFKEPPNAELGIIVVIPCFNDEFVFETLHSLNKATPPSVKVEVIIVVNSSIDTPIEIININRKIYHQLQEKRADKAYVNLDLLPIILESVPAKKAGVGHARKTGMDEAVRRFNMMDKPDGIIVSLDADALVNPSYFISIENAFKKSLYNRVIILQFQHDFNKDLYSKEEIEACKLYEIYLRYFRLSLALSGFPYAIHTIGSCFATDALTYTKTGGMPCKQGGEDFYFLHKTVQLTKVNTIQDILVYPAPRKSDRVPFGTGPAISKIIQEEEFKVYNFKLFFILKDFFSFLKNYSENGILNTHDIPSEIFTFMGEEKLVSLLKECASNSTIGNNLLKRLFSKFDAFFIIKFLNSFSADSEYPSQNVLSLAEELLNYYGVNIGSREDIYTEILKLDREI